MVKQGDNNCPICNALLWESFDYMDYTLMENQAECRNCNNYFYNYVTGNYQIFIGGQEFTWHYTMSDEEIERIQGYIEGEIELLKKELL